jgi:hypothetical protein
MEVTHKKAAITAQKMDNPRTGHKENKPIIQNMSALRMCTCCSWHSEQIDPMRMIIVNFLSTMRHDCSLP